MTHSLFGEPGSFTPAPVDQAALDLIRNSPVGPMLDMPVNDILGNLGLPPLPQLPPMPPMPGLPPLPVIDLTLLLKPLTDLLGSFGTGQLDASGFDPSQIFTGISKALDTSISVGSAGLQALDKVWSSSASLAAVAKGTEAQANTAAVSTQGVNTSINIQTAAAIVAHGVALLQAIIAKFIGVVVATGPFLVTPPGQAVVLAAATESLAEGTIVVAETRAQLFGPTGAMTANGQQVPITNAPTGTSPFAIASTILDSVGKPVSSLASTGLDQASTAIKSALAQPKPVSPADPAKAANTAAAMKPGGKSPGGPGGPGLGSPGVPATPLTPWNNAKTVSAGLMNANAPVGPSAPVRTAAEFVGGTGGGMMPMGAAGAAAGMQRGAESVGDEGIRGYLVTSEHGDEVVGEIEGMAPPVVGEAESRATEEVPDRELTL
ncbi:hypothetical protein JGU71_06795 [Antrihabitans sp. YC3-6]|uniref:Uncharacterized protein n=1 Tax=Antrihabitans stalagmiti TaxID=2799499 RepID=A0A934NNQ1_9NOCA|nr:hypothetical protein [Antrihabitans stalagmiti]MBJ8338586.1 hypothetical protein [Antrihabitans stalagmiti]